jgi:hypothetical protein
LWLQHCNKIENTPSEPCPQHSFSQFEVEVVVVVVVVWCRSAQGLDLGLLNGKSTAESIAGMTVCSMYVRYVE